MILRLLFILVCLPLHSAQVVVIVSNTPPTGNLNYVICGDAFDASNQAGFLHHATNVAYALTNRTYNSWIGTGTNNLRINVYAVTTNSSINGSTATAPNNDTPLGGYMEDGGFYVDGGKLGTIVGNAGLTPASLYRRIAVLNRGDYGGGTIGNVATKRTTITTNNNLNIAVHETGHLVVGLGDEYVESSDSTTSNTAPSLVESTNRWLNASAFPTLGAPVLSNGRYIPTSVCMMNQRGDPWCVVCSNQWALVTGFTNAASSSRPIPNIRTGTFRLR